MSNFIYLNFKDLVTRQTDKSIVMMRGKSPHSGYILGNQNCINLYVDIYWIFIKSYLTMDSRWWNTQLRIIHYKEEVEKISKRGNNLATNMFFYKNELNWVL